MYHFILREITLKNVKMFRFVMIGNAKQLFRLTLNDSVSTASLTLSTQADWEMNKLPQTISLSFVYYSKGSAVNL